MTTEQMILDRLDRLESQIEPLTASAKALGELREELAPRVNEAVQALDRRAGGCGGRFPAGGPAFPDQENDAQHKNLNFALDQMKNLIDFALTAEPLLKSSVPQVISFLDELEQRGVLRLFSYQHGGSQKGGRVLFGRRFAADRRRDGASGGDLKKLTAPEALDLLDRAADLPSRVNVGPKPSARGACSEHGRPASPAGMGVLVELTKGLATLRTQQ